MDKVSQVTAGPEHQDHGFIGPTRVHTDKGLVRISELKIADKVMSQPEAGGEQACKAVISTLAFDDKAIRRISYSRQDSPGTHYSLFVTDNHAFWVVEDYDTWEMLAEGETVVDCVVEPVHIHRAIGWTAAEGLIPYNHTVQLADGSIAVVIQNNLVYRTDRPGSGWVRSWGQRELPDDDCDGVVYDLITMQVLERKVGVDLAVFLLNFYLS